MLDSRTSIDLAACYDDIVLYNVSTCSDELTFLRPDTRWIDGALLQETRVQDQLNFLRPASRWIDGAYF